MYNLDREQLAEQVERGVRRGRTTLSVVMFSVHGGLTVLFLIIAWIMVVGGEAMQSLPEEASSMVAGGMIMLTVLSLLAVMFHLWSMLAATGVMDGQMRQQVIQQQFGMHLLGEYDAMLREKPKRSQSADDEYMRLSEDGELIPYSDDDGDEVDAAYQDAYNEHERRRSS